MRCSGLFLLAVSALAGAQEAPVRSPVILGYYPSWATHPSAKEIRYERFTHLAHAFLAADREGQLQENPGLPNPELVRRAHERGVKVLISLGGAQSAGIFRDIVRNRQSLERYTAAVARMVTENAYDGLDLDWEPTEAGEDRGDLLSMVRALRASLPGAILSMAAPPSDWYGRAWDVDGLRKEVDFLNVMAYDFHGPWSPHAGHNAPLRAAPEDEDAASASVESAMAYWSQKRRWPADRLVVGIPCYGRGFAVRRWHAKPAGRPVYESIDAHDVPRLLRDGWRRIWDPQVGVPTLLRDDPPELISYEDAASAALKGAWTREHGYRGVFFWNIEQDWSDGDHEVARAAGAAFRGK